MQGERARRQLFLITPGVISEFLSCFEGTACVPFDACMQEVEDRYVDLDAR